MYQVEVKSIGFLIDEWITAQFKVKVGVKEAVDRVGSLRNAIDRRLLPTNWRADDDVLELQDISRQCWDAQDRIMNPSLSYVEVVKAARAAQMANAQRNVLIRKIDAKLEIYHLERVPLEKTYYPA